MSTQKRSFVKATTWRLVAIIVLAIVSYVVTGKWEEVTAITLLYHSIQIAAYYFHERVWERISWGKIHHPLADIPVKQHLTPEDRELIIAHLRELGYLD